VRLAPDEQRYLDRLNLIGGFLEDSGDGTSMSDDPSLATVPSYEGFAIVGEPEPELPAGGTSEFEWNSVAKEPPSHAAVSFADLNETESQSEVSVLPDPLLAEPLTQSSDFAEGLVQTETDQLASEARGSPADVKVMMRQELESVDFYIAQGYSDIAFDTLELLEHQFGSHPEIESRRERLKTAKEDSKAEPLKSGPQSVGSGSIARAETDSPAADLSFGEIEIEQIPTVPTPAPVGSGIDSGLAEIFEEFRLEAEGESASSNEDFETHYNMATAYKEMDLLDEAIREFQIAAGLTGSVEAAPRFFQCCNMLGHCFVEKGMPRAAVLWFKKGLDAPGVNPEEYKALQYELGSAYEAMGDLTRAVAAFTEVYGVDVDYRDIAEKLESLQARTAAQKNKKKGN